MKERKRFFTFSKFIKIELIKNSNPKRLTLQKRFINHQKSFPIKNLSASRQRSFRIKRSHNRKSFPVPKGGNRAAPFASRTWRTTAQLLLHVLEKKTRALKQAASSHLTHSCSCFGWSCPCICIFFRGGEEEGSPAGGEVRSPVLLQHIM